MKTNLCKAVLLAIFSMLVLGQPSSASAQTGTTVGGFKEADTNDKYVVGAADFAVKTQSSKGEKMILRSILTAERQTVAGANYRLCLEVGPATGEVDDENGWQASALVFLSLKGVYTLSGWTKETCAAEDEDGDEEGETVTSVGTLQSGKTGGAIVYVGKETGDVAAYCFDNDSEAGRAILAACKNGEQCEFTGTVDSDAGCKIKDERELSASGKITSIKLVKSKSKRPVKGSAGGAAG